MKNQTVGIIGFGRFGQLLAGLLKDDFEVFVSNRSDKSLIAKKLGAKYVSLGEAAAKGLVILCVPISQMENVLLAIKPHLNDGALVIDTCSVKEYPLMLMKRLLPKRVEILGTHPLFGPDSFSERSAWRWAFCPEGRLTPRMKGFKSYLEGKGFRVIITDAAAHDRDVVIAINMPHLIGKALNHILINGTGVSTLNLERLKAFRNVALNDSEQLFRDVHLYNRFSKPIEGKFLHEMQKILRGLYE